MPSCIIANCPNRTIGKNKTTTLKYFYFPKEQSFQNAWLKACNKNEDFNISNVRICEEHFEADCFEEQIIRKLKKEAIPTKALNLERIEIEDGKPKKRSRPNGRTGIPTYNELLASVKETHSADENELPSGCDDTANIENETTLECHCSSKIESEELNNTINELTKTKEKLLSDKEKWLEEKEIWLKEKEEMTSILREREAEIAYLRKNEEIIRNSTLQIFLDY